MSKAALYKGLGVGLMSFGDNLSQQMAQSAEQRRQESLLALKRQWQLQDRAEDREWQTGLMEQKFAREDAMTADERAYQSQVRAEERAAAQEDKMNLSPLEERRAGLLEAQTDLTRAQAERGTTGADPSRWREMTLHEQRLIEQGKSPEEAYQEAMKLVYPQRSDWEQQEMLRQRADLSRSIQETLDDEYTRADLYEYHSIPDDTPPDEAAQLIFEQQWPTIERNVFGEQEQPAGDGSMNNPISIDSLSGPGDLQVGMYYLINGMTKRWTGEEMQ